MNKTSLPNGLKTAIGNEETDFIIFSERNQPLSKTIETIFFALVWLILPLIATYLLFKPLFINANASFSLDGILSKIWDNIGSKGVPALFVLLFLVIGFSILISGVINLFKKGGYYVGTETRLIHYNKNKMEYFDWEQFTGNMQIDFKKNSIVLELRRGKMRKKKNNPDQFIPETVYLSSVKKIMSVERTCRLRIKENDPTPSKKTS